MGTVVSLLKKTYKKWSDHHAPRLGASVAFYALLSFAPLLVLTVAVIALVFGQHRAEAGLIDQARQIIGDRGADAVKSLLANAQNPSTGVLASASAFVTLLFGASGVFGELRDALNTIWDAEPKNESGVLGMLKERLSHSEWSYPSVFCCWCPYSSAPQSACWTNSSAISFLSRR